MKIQPFFLFIALIVTALVVYTCLVYCQNNFKFLYTALGSFGSFIYFLFLIAIQFKNTRTSINIRALSALFFMINTGMLLYFSGVNVTASAFLILYTAHLLLYSSLVYSITKISA
jgi:hypothetical protein